MSFWSGLAGGMHDQRAAIEQQNFELAKAQGDQEKKILTLMLEADDPEIQSRALAGLLDSANPKQRKGGLRGWLGELESSPHLAGIQKLLSSPAFQPQQKQTLPATQSAQGVPLVPGGASVQPSVQAPPAPTGAAAMPVTAMVEQKGQAPPTPMSYTQAPPRPYSLPAERRVFMNPIDKVLQAEEAQQRGAVRGRVAGFVEAGGTREEGLNIERARQRAAGANTIRYGGTMKGDQIASGAQDTYGRPIDPNQHYRVQIQPDNTYQYLPTVAPGVGSAGVEYNRAAIQMGFRNASEVPATRRPELEATAERLTNELRYAGGIGTGQAQLATDQKKLLSPDDAAGLQSRYGITQGQAAALGRIPLTPPQVQAATESYLLDKDAVSAKALFEKIWPQVAQPEQRRIALMALQRQQNPDFIQLMSILKRMPLRLAVMTNGSRPSESDREAFDVAFPSTAADNWSLITVPTSYDAGLQLLTAVDNLARTSRESIGIIPLAERQQGGPPAMSTPGISGSGTTPGVEWQMINGVLHRNGTPY